ncbi:CsbD family protein [Xylophilus sp. GOD-11R]|uniref:CsbD family protein n=1 Tax=Xylophilus sp. GOD-11R TaxID=3089814 RepID=UPI00298BF5C9|nr:CsbD family protein [Xylophilus sp. GOD-11R]WPB59095.1 CsbD family protein [Xylophilus sp. GOD-11R]
MNKHQVEGRVEQAKGAVKEVAGKAVGNDRLQGEGMADKAAGKTQATYGDAKENLKDNVKKSVDKL